MKAEVVSKFEGQKCEVEIKSEDYEKDPINNTFVVKGALSLDGCIDVDGSVDVTIDGGEQAISIPNWQIVQIQPIKE